MALKKGEFIPAILKRVVRYSFTYGWHGRFKSWQAALATTTGYNADSVLQRVKAAASMVKAGQGVYERDAIVYNDVHYAYPLLAALLWIASLNDNNLSLIDYGGSLGTSYRQNYPFLKHLKSLHWGLIEQEMFVKEGQANFEDEHLKFYFNLQDCLKAQPNPHFLMFSSSLQYMEKPFELLDKVKETNIEFFMIDRTAFIDEPEDRLTTQTVPPAFYDASYPCWFFSLTKMKAYLEDVYEPIFTFESGQKVGLGLQELDYIGILWRRKK